MTNPNGRLPTVFLSHGGGPCFWVTFPEPIGAYAFDSLKAYLKSIVAGLPIRPKAFLVISAHWEESVPTIGSGAQPDLIYDYHGFPPHTYELKYPAPGLLSLASRVSDLLTMAGINHRLDAQRGFDHGVFVPFLMIDPDARIPVVTLSLRRDLNPAAHLAIGAALAPLRDEGVLIVGSGNSYHNLSQFMDGDGRNATLFDNWLNDTVTDGVPETRDRNLANWIAAPGARACHPREEHLMPLLVAAGAGGNDIGRRTFSGSVGKKAVSCFSFG